MRLAGPDGRADDNEAEAAGDWLTAPNAGMRLFFCLRVHGWLPAPPVKGCGGVKPVRAFCARGGFARASGEAAHSALDKAQHHEQKRANRVLSLAAICAADGFSFPRSLMLWCRTSQVQQPRRLYLPQGKVRPAYPGRGLCAPAGLVLDRVCAAQPWRAPACP
jgi:hypothetical protein